MVQALAWDLSNIQFFANAPNPARRHKHGRRLLQLVTHELSALYGFVSPYSELAVQ